MKIGDLAEMYECIRQRENILFVHQSLQAVHADIPGKFGVVPGISQQPLLIVYRNHLYGWQLIPQYDK